MAYARKPLAPRTGVFCARGGHRGSKWSTVLLAMPAVRVSDVQEVETSRALLHRSMCTTLAVRQWPNTCGQSASDTFGNNQQIK
eukprot:365122-Chlamydomonas_euryale.AAC.19